ncbi:tRNA dihydrouridine(20/20a) synthase DusA [Deefgea chitinilytica]|uniref:tRNA-dihydrouridine(20/20a) synthase n=1 Tax=Deefgea chitinilytica TaxID=570276 RepID=A0ABS2C9F4_9NEIS|nr:MULTISPECIES: tRNA dihydrouridine(20/20a) synthase DusA [Deefgea]MBM5570280.1 tRNA dihydrouridine(20/20a) synthase DusA [Deefgea chitinilytica]MBM9887509.1 tRNA dihydrouridine(20/20a) synthase DusA [Deefgea sp. CFH1-16]
MSEIKTQTPNPPSHRFCIAPMLDWTDRFYRRFARELSQHTWLYTEMVNTGAIIHGDQMRHLRFDPAENPLALQLGGSEPADLAKCAKIAEQWGYNEVNLNVGCPSERVQSGSFGACLMLEPNLVADGVKAMRDACNIDVTVKHRIGIDKIEDYSFVRDFVGHVAKAGCNTFIVHARNAILKGLSPKENRDIPPLKYDYAYQLKRDFPQLEIIINGGITTIADSQIHLQHVDGVMVGREAYHNPWILTEVDAAIYGAAHIAKTRRAAMENLRGFVDAELSAGTPLRYVARHILGLYQGIHGARHWRRMLSDASLLKNADWRLIEEALNIVESRQESSNVSQNA